MMIAPAPLLPGQPATETGLQLHRDLFRWLRSLLTAVIVTSVPPKGIVPVNLSADDIASYFSATGLGLVGAPYYNWAICNGNNGTPDLRATFLRWSGTAAGATGGSDSAAHTHSAGSLVAEIDIDTATRLSLNESARVWTSTTKATVASGGAAADAQTNGATVGGTTGAASATDNRPAFAELVPLMRVA